MKKVIDVFELEALKALDDEFPGERLPPGMAEVETGDLEEIPKDARVETELHALREHAQIVNVGGGLACGLFFIFYTWIDAPFLGVLGMLVGGLTAFTWVSGFSRVLNGLSAKGVLFPLFRKPFVRVWGNRSFDQIVHYLAVHHFNKVLALRRMLFSDTKTLRKTVLTSIHPTLAEAAPNSPMRLFLRVSEIIELRHKPKPTDAYGQTRY